MKKKNKSKAIESTPAVIPVTDFSTDDLAEQVTELYDHVAPYLGRVSAVTQILENVRHQENPSKEALTHAIGEFAKLPEHVRQACFNGWRVKASPIPRREMTERFAKEWHPIYRMLQISIDESSPANYSVEHFVGHFFSEGGRIHPLRLQIRQGAKLEDVLYYLEKLEKLIREHWANIITSALGAEL